MRILKPFLGLLLIIVFCLTAPAQIQRGSPVWLGNRTTNPSCRIVGSLYYNTASKTMRICTAIGSPGTWNDVQPSGIGTDLLGYSNLNFGTRVRITGTLGSTGNNDVYTVPAGFQLLTRNLLVWGVMAGFTLHWGVKEGANYRRLTPISAVGANGSRHDVYAIPFEQNEVVYLNSTVSGARWQIDGILVPVSQVNIVRAMVTTQTAATDTLLYQVPAGNSAIMLNPIGGVHSPWGTVLITNDAGVGGTLLAAFVLSGQTVGSSWYMQQSLAHSSGGIAQIQVLPASLSAGDAVWYQTSINNAGQVVWAAFIEVPL